MKRPAGVRMPDRLARGSFVLALLVVFVLPLVVLALTALSSRWPYPRLLPEGLSLRSLRFVRDNAAGIVRSLRSSLGYSTLTAVAAFALSIVPAQALARHEFRGRLFVEALLLSPVVIPAITYAMGMHFVLIRFGLADRLFGVVVVLTAASYPYMLRALIQGFRNVDPDIDVCAANLGAGALRRLITVHIPLLGPAIAAGGSIVFLVAFSEYYLVFLIGGGRIDSFTGYLYPFLTSSDRPLSAVLTMLFVLVPLLLFLIIEVFLARYYRRRGLRS